MTRDPNRGSAGSLSSEGGVDCGKSPNLLQNNQLAFATNCTVRGGFIKPRPGWKKIDLQFPNVAGALNGLRWEMPCTNDAESCTVNTPDPVIATLEGNAGAIFNVVLRIRGVIEVKIYAGGTNDGAYFQSDGTPNADGYNIYQLDVSSPAKTYYLNRDSGAGGNFAVDYECTIQVSAGATVTLLVDPVDGTQNSNYSSLTVPAIDGGVPYHGQYLQMDVVSVESSNMDSENVQSNFQNGRFQVSHAYAPNNGRSMICVMIGGRLFRVNVDDDNSVQDISIANDLNPSNRPLAWATQADNYFIVQDGQSKALIYNGGTTRRADPSKREVPTGSQIVYGMGRIWIARNNEYIAGDISGGPTSVLQFTETGYLNEGGSFVVPLQSGLITGLKFISSIDTSLGQGELVIFTEQSVFSNRVPPNRSTWKDSADAIQRIVQIDSGATSHRGVCGANGDLFYRSKEGIESLIVAVRQFGQWGNTPISREMNRVLEFDDRRLLQYVSSIKFDNRLMMTCSPVETAHGVYHRGLIELDFDLISSMGGKLPPAYDGLSTGIKILQLVDGMFSGIHRAFAFVLNNDNEIELWERTLADKFDNGSTLIQWTFETPSYNFGNPFDLKRLETADISIDELVGEVTITAQFKSDQAPYWTDWHTWSECSNKEDCDIAECGEPKSYQPQYRAKMRLPQPPDTCEETNGKPIRNGYEFQFRFVITGYCRIKQCRFHTYNLQESPHGECRSEGTCYGVNNCSEDIFSYEIEP